MDSAHSGLTPVRAADGRHLWTSTAQPGPGSTPWLGLGLLMVIATVLRAIHLDQGLWWDEIRTLVDSARAPLGQIVTVFPGDNQHTLFSVLAHISIAMFGESAWSLRLPAMLFGVATVPVLYFCAREFVGRLEALTATLLLAVSYHHVWFSQSARGYALLAFFTPLCTLLLLRGLRRDNLSDFVWYGFAATAAIYTHLSMVFLVASHAVLCVFPLGFPRAHRASWRLWRGPITGFTIAVAGSFLLYIPFVLAVRDVVVDTPSPTQGATPLWAVLEVLRGLRLGLGSLIGAAIGAILFLAGLWSYLRQSRFLVALFVLPGVLTLAAAVALHRPVRPRFVFFLAGFLILITIRGALELGRLLHRPRIREPGAITPAGLILVLIMIGLSAASLMPNYRYPKQDLVGAMEYVDLQSVPGDLVLTAGGARYPYAAYFGRDWTPLGSLRQLETLHEESRRIWVVHTLDSYIRSQTPDLMDVLDRGCTATRVFRGTVGDGDVTVCTIDPLGMLP